MKRFRVFVLALFLMCTIASAFAQGNANANDNLPDCYHYLLEGRGFIYGDEPLTVYAEQIPASDPYGTVQPGQHVHVEKVDRQNRLAYIYFYDNDTQEYWNFDSDCKKGWIDLYQVINRGTDHSYTVSNDKAGERLNLRSQPSSGSPSLGKYYSGTVATSLEEPRNGYVKVRIGHMAGYMDTNYLVPGLTCDAPELPNLMITNASGLGVNIRKMPQSGSEIIKTVQNDAVITVLGIRNDNWYHVMYEGEIGFAKADKMIPKLSYSAPTTGNSGSVGTHRVMSVENPDPSDRLNLREKPSSDAKSLGKFYNGTPVTVNKISNGWANVTIGVQSGWMDIVFLKELPYATDASVPVQTLANVAFTEKPSNESISTTGFPAGIIIKIYGDLNDGWHYAYYKGNWGYIQEGGIERDLKKDLTEDNSAAG